jgi:hypothetical protein
VTAAGSPSGEENIMATATLQPSEVAEVLQRPIEELIRRRAGREQRMS